MYQYKAILRSTQEIVAEGHSISDIEKGVKTFRRSQKKGSHTRAQEIIEIYHVSREKLEGLHRSKHKFIKAV